MSLDTFVLCLKCVLAALVALEACWRLYQKNSQDQAADEPANIKRQLGQCVSLIYETVQLMAG